MSKSSSYPIYEHLLIIGATSELAEDLFEKILPLASQFTLVGRDTQKLRLLQARFGKKISILSIDLSNLNELNKLLLHIQEYKFDGLIQLQGLGYYGHFEQIEIPSHLEVLEINFTSQLQIIHQFVKYQKDPTQVKLIVSVASMAGLVSCPYLASYSTAKAALIHLSKILDIELKPEFRVLTVCPGAFGKAFSLKASSGKYHKQDGNKRYFSQVIETITQVIEHKKPKVFCCFLDRIKWIFSWVTPGVLLKKLFKKTLLSRI